LKLVRITAITTIASTVSARCWRQRDSVELHGFGTSSAVGPLCRAGARMD
jgi:hypothetical protein